jgi:hypothetical protein
MNPTEIDVTRVLDQSDAQFAQTMLRLLATNASDREQATLRCLQAFVHADPDREKQLVARLATLDAGVRRQLLTPENIASLVPQAEPRAADALSVLWFSGVEWVRTQVAHLHDWIAGRATRLLADAASVAEASDSLLQLRRVVLRSESTSGPACYGGTEDLVEIPIVGSDVGEGSRVQMRLLAGRLRLSEMRVENAAARSVARGRPAYRLQGEVVLEVAGAMQDIEQGAGVLLVSKAPGLALSVTLVRDDKVLRGKLDELLPLDDAPSELNRKRLEARVWRSPRNRDRSKA